MSWLSKQILFLHRMGMIAFVDLVLARSAPAQTVPASPEMALLSSRCRHMPKMLPTRGSP
jgi:hypothetical protein